MLNLGIEWYTLASGDCILHIIITSWIFIRYTAISLAEHIFLHATLLLKDVFADKSIR